jgi:acetylornithine/succinyldiaminopimelate/putrescine aminotransferase
MGAFFVNEKVENVLQPGDHASTFGGNPVVAAADNAVMDVINEENLLDTVKENSCYLIESLKKLQQKYSAIKDVRGSGFLLGIEIDYSAAELVQELLEHHIVTVPAGTSVVRLLPPLTIKKEEIDLVLEALEQIFKKRT